MPDFFFGLSGKLLHSSEGTQLVGRGEQVGEQTCPLLIGDAVRGRGLGEGLVALAYLGTDSPVPLGTRGILYTWVLVVWLLIYSARGMCAIVVLDLLFLQIQLWCWGAASGVSQHPLPDELLSQFCSTLVWEDSTMEQDTGRL